MSFPSSLPSRFKISAAALAVSLALLAAPVPLALHAQDTLRRQHENELARAATPVEKAIALDKLGRFPEALSLLRDAARLAPGDPVVQLRTAIALDHNGDHAGARQIYDTLLGRIQDVWQNYARARKAGEQPPKPGAHDARLVGMSDILDENSAINYVFLGRNGKALSLFTLIYARGGAGGSDEMTNHAALWRVWLVAKMRADDGMRSKVALDTLIDTLAVGTPFHEAMLKFYQGKLQWAKLLEAVSDGQAGALTKERHMTEAYFFAAGYFRYVRRDNETALKLLEARDALPYDGCVERLFIRDEIKSLKTAAGN
jgi:tetratricopeptide (TPR) repeat protein